MRVKLTRRGAITVPKRLRDGLPANATLDVVLRDDGVLEVRPATDGDAFQSSSQTSHLEQMEQEAEDDFAAGRYETFDGVNEFLDDLEANAKRAARRA